MSLKEHLKVFGWEEAKAWLLGVAILIAYTALFNTCQRWCEIPNENPLMYGGDYEQSEDCDSPVSETRGWLCESPE